VASLFVPGAYPAHQPVPCAAVDVTEHGLGHPVPEVVRPPASDLFKLVISSSRPWWRVDLYVLVLTLSLIAWMALWDGLV